MIVNGYEIKPGANLWNADLWNADLKDAVLWGANLKDANLKGVYLKDADLRGTNVTNTILEKKDADKDLKIKELEEELKNIKATLKESSGHLNN